MPSLLRYMDCRIHVDVCLTANVFMYLYKYLFKGPDQARFNFQAASENAAVPSVEDELETYIGGRYLSSSEVVYRIFAFHITSKQPSVRCLAVHLENTQLGQLHRSDDGQSLMSDLL